MIEPPEGVPFIMSMEDSGKLGCRERMQGRRMRSVAVMRPATHIISYGSSMIE
jgi:hypothetical protein